MINFLLGALSVIVIQIAAYAYGLRSYARMRERLHIARTGPNASRELPNY